MLNDAKFDLAVIGGGINGAGIARDAAGRGLKVLLCEKDDFARHTSSASTKLIHGGLRYLEHYDFALVRHSLQEREVLLRSAPHIIWPLRFVLPHHAGLRPRWLIRLGLFLYDHLTRLQHLEVATGIRFDRHPAGAGLKSDFVAGFEYSDCWVQDARLVVLNALDAAARGATVLSRTACTALTRHNDCWQVGLNGKDGGYTIRARCVLNASGPWVDQIHRLALGNGSDATVRLVKGSHIVVRRLFNHAYPYIFQNRDGRIFFAIPFETDFTLVGTTEQEIDSPENEARISEEEIDYLLHSINVYLRQPIARGDIIWTYSGIRPLYDDAADNASRVTRDYVLKTDDRGAPLVSVYGGKITTYRVLAEDVLKQVGQRITVPRPSWTKDAVLPGGDGVGTGPVAFAADLATEYPWLPPTVLARYACHYGSRTRELIGRRQNIAAMGLDFGAGLYAAEVDYLVNHEFARTSDDVLWRRTKLGLKLTGDRVANLDNYLNQ